MAKLSEVLKNVAVAANEPANRVAIETALESAFENMKPGAFQTDSALISEIQSLLRAARDRMGPVGFQVTIAYLLRKGLSLVTDNDQVGAFLGPLASASDEAVEAFITTGKINGKNYNGNADGRRSSRVTGKIVCIGGVVYNVEKHNGNLPQGAIFADYPEQTDAAMTDLARANKEFCPHCFTADEVGKWISASALAREPIASPAKRPPASKNFIEWSEDAQNIFTTLYDEVLKETAEGDWDRGLEKIGPVLKGALDIAVHWSSETANAVFKVNDEDWKEKVDDRSANIRDIFTPVIAKVIALAHADKGDVPKDLSKSGALAKFFAGLSDTLKIPEEWRGPLDAAVRTLPEFEQRSLLATIAESSTSIAGQLAALASGLGSAVITLLVGSWLIVPIAAYYFMSTSVAMAAMWATMFANYLPGFVLAITAARWFAGSTPSSNTEQTPVTTPPPSEDEGGGSATNELEEPIAGGPQTRLVREKFRERRAQYAAAKHDAKKTAAHALAVVYLVYAAPLLAAVTGSLYSGILTLRGDFIWMPTFTVVMWCAIWYIPFLTVDMFIGSVAAFEALMLNLLPFNWAKERIKSMVTSEVIFNTWKDVALKAANGLHMLNLLPVLIWWPVYPFGTIPAAIITLAAYLMVTSWYGSSLLTMKRVRDLTDVDVKEYLRIQKIRYTKVSFNIFATGVLLSLVGTLLLTVLNGGIQLQYPDKNGLGGRDRLESVLTIFTDLGTAAKQKVVTQAKVAQQAAAKASANRDRCEDLKVALQQDAGFCGRPQAAQYPQFCEVDQNPDCRTEILRSVGTAKAKK